MTVPRIGKLAVLASIPALALASAASAQEETTVIEQHKVVPAPAPVAPPPATATVTKTTTVHTSTSTGPVKPVVHHRAVHHARTVHAAAVVTKTAVQVAPPSAPAQPAATFDRKTVIHRDAAGDVTRDTEIQKQDANGITTVEHHADIPGDAVPSEGPGPGASPDDR